MQNPNAIQKFVAEFKNTPPLTKQNTPLKLPISQIHTLPDVFQVRSYGLTRYHVNALEKELKSSGELDPIEVCWVSKKFVVVNGHHRLEAYRQSGIKKPIPIKLLIGLSGLELVEHAVSANRKLNLPMDKADIQESRWTLARMLLRDTGKLSAERMKAATGAPKGTCQAFREAFKALEGEGLDPFDHTWKETREVMKGHIGMGSYDFDEFDPHAVAKEILFTKWKITPILLQQARGHHEVLLELVLLIAGSRLDCIGEGILQHLPENDPDEFRDF